MPKVEMPLDWIDSNGPVSKSRYLQLFSNATGAPERYVGLDGKYRANCSGYYTVETHLSHLPELHAGDRVQVLTHWISSGLTDVERLEVGFSHWHGACSGSTCTGGPNMKVSAVTCHPTAPSAWCQRDPLVRKLTEVTHCVVLSQEAYSAVIRRGVALHDSLFGELAELNASPYAQGRHLASNGMFHRSWLGLIADLFLADLAWHGELIKGRLPRILMERFIRQHLAFSRSCRN